MIAGGISAYRFHLAVKRAREFEAIQARAKRWGGHMAREIAIPATLRPYRATVGDPLLSLLGEDFGNQVGCWGTQASESELMAVLDAEPFHTVYLGGAVNLGDAWVGAIRKPDAVGGLHLDGTRVTDACVDRLMAMTNLGDLGLVDTVISDAGVDRLRRLPKLRHVFVGGPNIRDVRLVDGEVVDSTGRRATTAGPGLSVRGLIQTNGKIIPEGNVRVMVRPAGSPPPWKSVPYGWNAPLGNVGNLVRTSPNVGTIDLPIGLLPPGRSTVEVWFDDGPIFYRAGCFEIDLAPLPAMEPQD